MSPLVECMPSIRKTLGSVPSTHKPDMVVPTFSPSTEELEGGDSDTQDHLGCTGSLRLALNPCLPTLLQPQKRKD